MRYVVGRVIPAQQIVTIKMNKKAAGQIIAWVLLFGFAISLAIGIFSWSKVQTEDLTESTVNFVEGKLECREVKINVKKDPDCTNLNISNRGKLTITKISIASLDGSNSNLLDANIIPLQSKAFPYQIGSDIEVLPIINISRNDVGCVDRKVRIEC